MIHAMLITFGVLLAIVLFPIALAVAIGLFCVCKELVLFLASSLGKLFAVIMLMLLFGLSLLPFIYIPQSNYPVLLFILGIGTFLGVDMIFLKLKKAGYWE